MRIYLAQCNPIIGAIDKNTAKIIDAIEEAKKQGCALVVFSEMALCGYFPDDLVFEPGFVEACDAALVRIAEHSRGIAVVVGTVCTNRSGPGRPFRNSAAILQDGQVIGFQDKSLLPTYDVFDEDRYIEPASQMRIWNICGKNVAITVCEDMWPTKDMALKSLYKQDPLDWYEKKELDLFINISASPYSKGKIEERTLVAQAVAHRLNCPVVVVNQVGGQDGMLYDGSSLFIARDATVVARCSPFQEEGLVCDEQAVYEPVKALHKAEELFCALVMGVRDYFTKQGHRRAVLGLSGGIDSAVVACIAQEALGRDHVFALLLPSRFTASYSIEDAINLCRNLGISSQQISIEGVFCAHLEALGLEKDEMSFGIVQENLQARCRAALLMAVSNQKGSLLLNTSNKSEAAMGYTTLYGDSCGALSVLGDLLKSEVYEVGRWINREREVIAERIFTRPPSAELKYNQKDADTLPEYTILDAIVEDFVVHRQPPMAIAQARGFDPELVKRVCCTIYQNEYKRRQLPFSLRVSQKAFSCGRRVPIVHDWGCQNVAAL